ncbi:Phage virion morphogenesis protein [Chromobacterium vaccinii]|nr:Phage virion morphogenesis protein [Chromobacterium vaccinii]QND89409.1 Phage virion morphogenesis protein [Chromobacterium vaccinii]
MSDFVSIVIQDDQVQRVLRRLESSVADMTPAMRAIAASLAFITEENFEAEGRPSWTPSQRATNDGGVTLQHRGQLAASVVTTYDAHSSQIGSNLDYARIHQLGGDAGRNQTVELEPRPYLPMNEDEELQPEASEAVIRAMFEHLKRAAAV